MQRKRPASTRRLLVRRHVTGRRGAATLDYVLTLGTLLALSSVAVGLSRRMIQLTYEMINGLVAWPFM